MKHYLLFLFLTMLSYTALADNGKYQATENRNGNLKAFGYYGSGRLPVGYQFFMGIEHIGKMKTSMGFQIINQFSSGANHDLSGTVFRKNNILNASKLYDNLTYNARMRKLQFNENPQVVFNQRAWYTIIIESKYSVGAGIDIMDGTEDNYGLLINAGKYFPSERLCLNAACSFISGRIDYKTSISKTVSFGTTTNYGIEIAVENFQGYKDLSLGVLIYL